MEMRFEIWGLFDADELNKDPKKKLEHFRKHYADKGFLRDSDVDTIYKHYNNFVNLNIGDEVLISDIFCTVFQKWYNADENYMHYGLQEE